MSFPPPLNAESERRFFRQMHEGSREARDKLIMHNLRLVAHIVKKYCGNQDEQDDLISIGTVGLIKAIDSFKIENGTRFATYAAKCLQNEIFMYFRSRKKFGCEISMHEPIDTDNEGNPLTYLDIVCSEDTIAENINTKMQSAKALKAINERLDRRERAVIVMRYGLCRGRENTQKEVAEKLGISRSYVSRIEKQALKKIRDLL